MVTTRFMVTGLLLISLCFSCHHKLAPSMQPVNTYAIRLKPGEDLKRSIQAFVDQNKLGAAWICTGVGSLVHYNIRFANQQSGSTGEGHFEIVGLTGTLSVNGSHMHISISDSTGKTMGGHLLENCIVYTTAEIVIQSTDKLVFKRAKDGTTPWEELQIEK